MRKELELFVNHNNIKAAIILNCVESLLETNIRYANQPNRKTLKDYFKILSLSGMVIINGFHLHIAIAYKKVKQLVIINKWKHFIN